MHSPATLRHSDASELLFLLLSIHATRHDLGLVKHEKTLICLARNDYEPDICFFSKTKAARFKPEQLKFPAPDFIVEVLSPSTEATDRGVKFEDYAANGVREYWLVDPARQQVEQYLLRTGKYHRHASLKTGDIASNVITGFRVPVRACFDRTANLAALQKL